MANQVTTTFKINAQGAINSLNQYNTQLAQTIRLQNQLGRTQGSGAGGGGDTGGGGGLLGGIGGLGKGLLGGLTFAAVVGALKTAVDASNELARANRALSSSAVEAGVSYTQLADANERFAKSAGISTAQASRSTAQLQRLVSLAGEADQLEKYQKGFLDLAAARGVAFEELDTLFQGIIAGTDDALNRFGKQDPSKLAAQYAAQLGKSVDQLTEQEKILSRLKAFDKDFGLFNGTNEARLRSFDGQMDVFNGKIQDTIALFGSWITSSQGVNEWLGIINETMQSLGPTISGDEVQRFIDAGLNPQEIMDTLRQRGEFNSTTWENLTSIGPNSVANIFGLTGPGQKAELRAIETFEKILNQFALTEDQKTAVLEAAEAKRQSIIEDGKRKEYLGYTDALKNQYEYEKVLFEGNLSLFEAERKMMLDGTKASELRYAQEVGAVRVEALQRELEMQNQLFQRQMMYAQMTGQSEEFDKVRREQRIFNAKQNFAIELESLRTQQEQARIQKEAAEQRKNVTRDLRNQILGYAANQNPYVRIFTDAQNALEDLVDKTKEFGKQFGRTMVSEIQSQFNLQLLGQDIDNLVKAVQLRQEARQYRGDRDLEALFPGYNISEQIDAAERAFSRANREGFGSDAERRAAERRRDQAIIGLTSGLDVEALRGSVYGGGILADAASAREREADRLERDRQTAQDVFEQVLREFSDGGLRVRLANGEQVVRIINEAPESASVAERPGRGATNGRYGN